MDNIIENEPCFDEIQGVLTILQNSGKKYDIDKISEAFLYAKELHEGQFRNSGEPYISHPIAVAEIVAALGLDSDSICAAFLHDTVEDCSDKTDIGTIEKMFGTDVAGLVSGLTKLVDINIEDKEEAQMENIRRMLLAMSKDIRVIFIKLCDRLHNMRTLEAKSEDKRRKTALETMHVYAPLAHRLGMQRIKQELENLALLYLDPIGYKEVTNNIEEKYGMNRGYIDSIRSDVAATLEKYGIPATLEGRVKTVYSIYRKMFNQSKQFDEIYDFYALRIIVETELQCYTALGIIHEMYKSVPGRFKDYISTPKPNMYQSLHTTVIGSAGVPFEVQIRTREMHHVAEYGIAAHWKYKSGSQSKEDIDRKLEWVSKLIDSENDNVDPDEFMHSLKIDIFHDETFVFTPKGDVIALPQGSTLIDFAYAIHSQVGNKMVGAKINGMISPIDKCPQNGEIVEIITSSASKGPSRDWLKIVKTGEARNKIRQWFKKEKREENIEIGRADLDREINRIVKKTTEAERTEIIKNTAAKLGMQSDEDLCNIVGYGGMSIAKIFPKLKDEAEKHKKVEEEQVEATPQNIVTIASPQTGKSGGVIVDGLSGCAVKYAKCCNPLPGDEIIGFVTKGYGVSIHKCDCVNIKNIIGNDDLNGRLKSAVWDVSSVKHQPEMYEAAITMFVADNIGVFANISAALADMRVSIIFINSRQDSPDTAVMNIKFTCKDVAHFDSVVARLRGIQYVNKIVRGTF